MYYKSYRTDAHTSSILLFFFVFFFALVVVYLLQLWNYLMFIYLYVLVKVLILKLILSTLFYCICLFVDCRFCNNNINKKKKKERNLQIFVLATLLNYSFFSYSVNSAQKWSQKYSYRNKQVCARLPLPPHDSKLIFGENRFSKPFRLLF